ncbi:TPA: hypothetical protein DCZ36_00625 [Candidatus Gracilibacteria bacterium]|nr:hypothetical protein [Candidatus Gracilibacteria bacterium]
MLGISPEFLGIECALEKAPSDSELVGTAIWQRDLDSLRFILKTPFSGSKRHSPFIPGSKIDKVLNTQDDSVLYGVDMTHLAPGSQIIQRGLFREGVRPYTSLETYEYIEQITSEKGISFIQKMESERIKNILGAFRERFLVIFDVAEEKFIPITRENFEYYHSQEDWRALGKNKIITVNEKFGTQ